MKKILLTSLLMMSTFWSAQINLGTGSTNSGNAPINTYYGYSYVQQIYTKQEINANAAGNITGLKFYLDPSASLSNSSDWVVYLGETSMSKFTSGSSWIPSSQLTQVYAGAVTNANGIVEITFSTPFPYTNVGNLVIAAEENSSGYNGDEIFSVYNGVAGSTISYSSDNTNPDPTSPPTGELLGYKSVVSIIGLTGNGIPICPSVNYPLNNSTLVEVSPTITWLEPQGATGYKISIGTSPGGTDVVNQQVVTGASFTPSSPLNMDTTHYLKVIAIGTGGESSSCSDIQFKTIPAPPLNDECTNATQLTVSPNLTCTNPTAGTTLAATDSNVPSSPCFGNPDDDVWFKFTATESTQMVVLSNVVSVGADPSTDMYFQVFSGDCNGLSSILCSDDNASAVSGLTVGDTYYIRVFSYGGTDNAQSFTICVGTLPPPPSNDECADAISLVVNPGMDCGSVTAGYTLGATDSNVAPSPCIGNPDDDVWFKFTATASTHMVSLKDVFSVGSDYSIDTYFQILSGGCSGLTSVLCSDDNTAVVGGLTAGETYYIRVYSYGDAGNAQSFNICIGTIPPPPANDECSGALGATIFPYSYTQTDAAGATNNNGFIMTCADDGMNDGTWFTFTGDGTVFDITVSTPVGSDFDSQIGVYSGSCGNLVCENTEDSSGMGGTETISIPTVAGTVYYVNVGDYDEYDDHMEGVFTITINKETLGTSEISKTKDYIKVYPNPFTEMLNITKADQVRSVSVSDISGRLVKTIENPSSVLHFGDLKQGVYILILNMKDGSKQMVKIIKK